MSYMEKLEKISTKLGIPIDKLVAEYNAYLNQTKALFPGRDEAFCSQRALVLVSAKHVEELRSPSVSFEFVSIYTSEIVDINARMKQLALEAYKTNPAQAIATGLVNESGVPLDTRQWLVEPTSGRPGRKNPNFRKPLMPFEQRRVVGFCVKFGTDKVKLFDATLRGEQAKQEVPENVPLTARFNIRGEDGLAYHLTSGSRTKVMPSESKFFKNWSINKTIEILENAPFKKSVLDCEEHHEKHKNEPTNLILCEAHLVGKSEEQTSRGSYLLFLTDLEKGDFDAQPIPCFVDEANYKKLEGLGSGTKLLILGSTSLGQDLATGEQTRVILNGLFLHVLIPIKEEELKTEFETTW